MCLCLFLSSRGLISIRLACWCSTFHSLWHFGCVRLLRFCQPVFEIPADDPPTTKTFSVQILYLTHRRLFDFPAMSQKGEVFDSNCMTLTRFVLQEQKKFKVSDRPVGLKAVKLTRFLFLACNRWLVAATQQHSDRCQGHRVSCKEGWHCTTVSSLNVPFFPFGFFSTSLGLTTSLALITSASHIDPSIQV